MTDPAAAPADSSDSILDAAQALFTAIHANNLEGVEVLVQAKPEVLRALSPSGLSPVLFATYYHRPAILDFLLAAGAPLSVFEAAASGQTGKLTELLDADPAQLSAFSPDGFSLLGLAAFFGRTEAVRELLSRGAEVSAVSRNPMRVQPLHSAVAGNHTEIVRLLLDAGADVNAAQAGGWTPLMSAVQNGNPELVALLLSHGANTGHKTADGQDVHSLLADEPNEAVSKLLNDMV